MVQRLIEYISIFLALIIVLPLHEFAHAFVAVKSGDYTPKIYGRYTLNPLAHFDTLGLIMFVIAHFGWAKPVPINPAHFRHYKLDSFLVSSAGTVLQKTLLYVVRFGLVFCVFNLLPIFPLDGFGIIDCFIKRRTEFYYNYKKYGILVLYALILLSFIADYSGLYYLDILGIVMNYMVNIIIVPITAFWGLIF